MLKPAFPVAELVEPEDVPVVVAVPVPVVLDPL